MKKPPPRVARALLITPSGRLTPKAEAVFKALFRKYSYAGKMGRADLARFFTDCTMSAMTAYDVRVTDVINDYDSDFDGALTEVGAVLY